MIDAPFCNAVSLLTGFTGWVLAVWSFLRPERDRSGWKLAGGGMACALAGQVPVSWQTTPDGWLVASYAGGTARLFDPTGAGAGRVYQSLAPTETAGVLTACLGGERGLVDYRGEWLWQA